jgi:predicted P-loop ATPase
MTISVYPAGKEVQGRPIPASVPSGQMEFSTYINYIKDGKWQDEVLAVRTGKMDKMLAPGVTVSGTFSKREAKSIVQHSGIIAIDIDEQDNADLSVDELAADNFIYALHRSIRGRGYVAYFRIDPVRHLDAFKALEKRLADSYSIIVDPSGKDVSRYRFVSYDPDAFIKTTPPPVFKSYLQKPKEEPRKIYPHTQSDIDYIMEQIASKRVNLVESYYDWINVGLGIANKYGEAGRGYFHTLSQQSAKYEHAVCDKKYDNLLKTNKAGRTIATFFYLCKEAGLDIQTKRTKHIQTTAVVHRKKVGENGGYKDDAQAKVSTKRILTEIDGIEGEDIDEVIEAVFAMDMQELHSRHKGELDDVIAWVKSIDLKFNEITREYEYQGTPINKTIINDIVLAAQQTLGQRGASKQTVEMLIDSSYIQKYHPFKQFFDSRKGQEPDGYIQQLCDCIEFRQVVHRNGMELQVENYVELFLTKWLLSVVASMHGTYSLLVLVLTGGQGIGKTNFFRWLLPKELHKYYGESKLDAGKDDEILMCKKIILCDDEFGGKSKQEAKKLKELSSKQTFNLRRPYGMVHEDLQRMAVLCGTSNDEEIINDPTGNRRIIPINVVSIDWEKYKLIDKDLLWMEVYNLYQKLGDKWMLDKDEIAILNEATSQNEQPSIEAEAIMMYFKSPQPGDIVKYWPNTKIKNYIEMNSRLQVNSYKLGAQLKKLGFAKKFVKIGGIPAQCYGIVLKTDTEKSVYPNATDNQEVDF